MKSLKRKSKNSTRKSKGTKIGSKALIGVIADRLIEIECEMELGLFLVPRVSPGLISLLFIEAEKRGSLIEQRLLPEEGCLIAIIRDGFYGDIPLRWDSSLRGISFLVKA